MKVTAGLYRIIKERYANSDTGTGFTLKREAVRDLSTALTVLASLKMTNGSSSYRGPGII